MIKKMLFFSGIILPIIYKSAYAQEIIDTPIENYIRIKPDKVHVSMPVNGRVIGTKLEIIAGAVVLNICTAEKDTTNSRGIFMINAAKGDSIAVTVSQYSKGIYVIKNPNEKLNIILIKRKAEILPAGHTLSEYKKALKEDSELYRILEKSAKLEGKWNY